MEEVIDAMIIDNMIYGDTIAGIQNISIIPNTLAIISSQNLYTYGMNNSTRYIDLDGKISIPLITGAIGGLIGDVVEILESFDDWFRNLFEEDDCELAN